MQKIKYCLLSLNLVIGTLIAEEGFNPRITVNNQTSAAFSLYVGGKPNLFDLPKGQSRTFYHVFHTKMLYLSKNAQLGYDEIRKKAWCIVDTQSEATGDCWTNNKRGHERYRISPCVTPLISKDDLERAQREQKDIVATIENGNSQDFIGSIAYVSRRGYLGAVWNSTKSFVGSLFGRP